MEEVKFASWRRIVVLAIATSSLAGCNTASPEPEEPRTDGPLKFDISDGGTSLWAPRGHTESWSGSFGAFWGCVEEGEATITKVEPRGDVPDDAFHAWIHTVPKDAQGRTGIGSELGSPPKFDEPYATGARWFGTFTPAVDYTWKQPCPADGKDGITEVVITMDSGVEGREIEGFKLTYSADGEDYTVNTDWNMMLCGTEMTPSRCKGLAEWK